MKIKKGDNFHKWLSALTPLYGERETMNIWRWYKEASRPEDQFENDLALLAKHFPIQYLTGYSYFYGEKFHVNKNTLIPRPETEELVYEILEDHPNDRNLSVIDLGTGTGCIAITLKKQRPEWQITGMDLYEKTLDVARKNSQFHQVRVKWIKGDILELSTSLSHSYDIIVSNPPYISPDEATVLERNVLDYEPHNALFTRDIEGLEFYKAIAAYSRKSLHSGVEIYLEIHEHSSQQIIASFDDPTIFKAPKIIRDMQGKDRIMWTEKR